MVNNSSNKNDFAKMADEKKIVSANIQIKPNHLLIQDTNTASFSFLFISVVWRFKSSTHQIKLNPNPGFNLEYPIKLIG